MKRAVQCLKWKGMGCATFTKASCYINDDEGQNVDWRDRRPDESENEKASTKISLTHILTVAQSKPHTSSTSTHT